MDAHPGPRRSVVEPIDYHRMRLLCFRAALIAFGRRWGIQLGIAAVVFGAGSNAPLQVAAAMAGLLLWPLRAAADGSWLVVPATIAYALAGALPVVLTRPLWWPRAWADAERSLPIPAATLRASDRRFAVLLSIPWQGLLLAGGLGIGSNGGATADPHEACLAVAACVVAAVGALRLAQRWMGFVRGMAGRGPSTQARERTSVAVARIRVIGPRRALVVLPLIRGRARRSAFVAVGGALATTACATGRAWWSVDAGWSLALLALVSLVATSQLRAAAARELRPLWIDDRQLPIDLHVCERATRLLVLLPVLAGCAACFASVALRPESTRFIVLAAYAGVLALGCAIEATTRETMQPSDHAARWILMLALAVAFGSEVAPS